MNEHFKIGEAKFFLEKMEESIGDRVAFRYNLSAFLSAARSVIFYAKEEAKRKRRSQWWEHSLSKSDVLYFFGTRRNVNVHREQPVDPPRDIHADTSEIVGVFDVASDVYSNNKLVGKELAPQDQPPLKSTESTQEQTILYRFDEWSGPEDVIKLSHRYIEALENFVQDGIEKNILTG
jgi:hypothetical protein